VEVSFRPVGGAEGQNSPRFLTVFYGPNRFFFVTDQKFSARNAVFWAWIGSTERDPSRKFSGRFKNGPSKNGIWLRQPRFNFQPMPAFPVTYGPETKPSAHPPDKIHFESREQNLGEGRGGSAGSGGGARRQGVAASNVAGTWPSPPPTQFSPVTVPLLPSSPLPCAYGLCSYARSGVLLLGGLAVGGSSNLVPRFFYLCS
jgi:hypothetical protein